ncbi:MAG: preprotein translocase subunit SecE [Thermoleophilaceae bacterium]
MARNRQRAKERQAERRAARQAGTPDSGGVPDAQRRVDAPPEELGRSDFTLEHTTEDEEFIGDLDGFDEGDDGASETTETVAGPRGVRGGREREEAEHHERGRVMGFLHAVWAELQRVQWPNRSQLTSLTGITLAFVLIVGGYLGLLDAIFSKLVSAIL